MAKPDNSSTFISFSLALSLSPSVSLWHYLFTLYRVHEIYRLNTNHTNMLTFSWMQQCQSYEHFQYNIFDVCKKVINNYIPNIESIFDIECVNMPKAFCLFIILFSFFELIESKILLIKQYSEFSSTICRKSKN